MMIFKNKLIRTVSYSVLLSGVVMSANAMAGDVTINTPMAINDESSQTTVNNADSIKITTGADVEVTRTSTSFYSDGSGNITIDGGKLIATGTGVDAEGIRNVANVIHHAGTGSVVLSGGEVSLDNALIKTDSNSSVEIKDDAKISIIGEGGIHSGKNINISGGELTLTTEDGAEENAALRSDGATTISGGKVNLIGGSEIASLNGAVSISGGEVTMQGTAENEAVIWSPGGDLTISGNDTIINMNGNSIIDSVDDRVDQNGNPIGSNTNKLNISGGTINVSGTKNILGAGGDITMSDGELNITSNSVLQTWDGVDEQNPATLNFTGGDINLSGKLDSNLQGAGNLNFMTSDANVSGNIEGSNLSFENSHKLSNAISGTIGDLASLNVNKGTLAYDKTTGKITDLTVADGANIEIGTNTLSATNADFANNSSLGLQIVNDTTFGKIKADQINIGTGTNMNVTLDNGIVAKDSNKDFAILDSANITGDFENLINKNNRYEFTSNGDGSYNVKGIATAADVVKDSGGSANNAGTATAWEDNTSFVGGTQASQVANSLNNLSQTNATAYVNALTALAPDAAPAVQATATEGANQVFGAVGSRLSGGSVSGSQQGMSSGDSNADNGAMWVQGLYNKSKLDTNSGFDSDSQGIAFGAEKNLNDDVKLGIGYAYTTTDIDGFMRKTDVDTHTAIVYGEYKPSNWYVNGIATYGWSEYDENKNVAGINVNSKYDVDSIGLQAMTGYDFNLNGTTLTPETGLRYVNIQNKGYTDSAGQSVADGSSDILTGVLGAKVSKDFEVSNGMRLKPEMRIAATYDLVNDDANSVVTLANGAAYTTKGEALDKFGMEFGAGVTAEVNDDVELSLGYEGKFRQDYSDHTGLVNAKYKF